MKYRIYFYTHTFSICIGFSVRSPYFNAAENKNVRILSVNAINREGRVEADAKRFELPFPVLVGRDSDITKNYKIKSLPQLVIIDMEGKIVFYDRFADFDQISEILDKLLQKKTPGAKPDSTKTGDGFL